ncbi:MAG: 3-isopropylmalate dehydratase [Chromatiales bacterium]|nr:3-isopropylmalate dehydratase [Chromatiales bacterium]
MSGRAWVFGDGVNTDVMAPGLFFKAPLEVLAAHCMEAIEPAFAANIVVGDIVVAGRNFGVGSAREQAPMALQHLGVGAILAESYGRIFYRNALSFGIPTLLFPQAGEIVAGDELVIDPLAGRIENRTRAKMYTVAGLPEHLMAMVSAGGLMPYLKQRLSAQGAS